MGLKREHVIWAYRLFLEREPESEQAIEEKMRTAATLAELRAQLLASPEFQSRNALVHPTLERPYAGDGFARLRFLSFGARRGPDPKRPAMRLTASQTWSSAKRALSCLLCS
jgi:hypothetical protein